MPMELINVGSAVNDKTGEALRGGLVKVNANTAEVYGALSSDSGVSFPAVVRGTVSAERWSGVTKGTGLTSTARQANLTGLQAAVNYAATNRKFFEIEPGDYEIEGTAGLVIPRTKNTGFVWRGTKGSHIKQFSNNCPIITIGDITTSGNLMEQAEVKGFRVSYATDQSANTASSAVRMGLARNCSFGEWNIFADSTVSGWPAGSSIRSYRGLVFQHAVDSMTFFSNTLSDVMIGGAQQNLMSFGVDGALGGGGTGNIFSNIYMANGVTGSPQTIADYALRLRGQADMYESVFQQINIEWCIANKLCFAEIVRNTTLESWHLEGNRLSGADPCVFNVSGSQMNFFGLNILDLEVLSASATGTASIFTLYADCTITGNGLALNWSGSGKVNRAFQLLMLPSWQPNDFPPAVNIQGIALRDVTGGNGTNFFFDANTPTSTVPAPIKTDVYRWKEAVPELRGLTCKLNANTTYNGVEGDVTYIYPATLGAARVVTLAATMKPSGALAAVPVPVGTIVTVRRGPGTADGSALTVRNLTTGGTLLATLSAADSVAYFRFDSTNWSAVT